MTTPARRRWPVATRDAITGIGALGVLSLVHWARAHRVGGPPIVQELMGVLPNAAAAVAIPFVLLAWWENERRPTSAARRRALVWLTGLSGVGLVLWEFGQRSSRALFFDPGDIVATLVGLAVVWVVNAAITAGAASPD